MQKAEIGASDTIRLILQFLKENHLYDSLRTLQEEANESLCSVECVETFLNDIKHGHWDNVLQQTNALAAHNSLMMDLYELIAIEMTEIQEKDVAEQLISQSQPLQSMKQLHPSRYENLQSIVSSRQFDPNLAYGSMSKQRRRDALVEAFRSVVSTAPPSRLLILLGQALKWQQMQGLLTPGADFNIFQGSVNCSSVDKLDEAVRRTTGKIKFSKNSPPQCARFSLDGQMLITGSKDGFVEVWDYKKCQLRKDLDYQAKDELMMHTEGITALGFSLDGEMLVTGSEAGEAKVWKILNGLCLRKFVGAHSNAIHSTVFSRDSTKILSASFDEKVRIHGLKSGKLLKEFHGHEGYVNAAIFSRDDSKVISCSSDGTLRIWCTRTARCLEIFRSPESTYGSDIEMLGVLLPPQAITPDESMIVCTRSYSIFQISTSSLELIKTFKVSPDHEREHGFFVAHAMSQNGKLLYGLTEKGFLICFDVTSASIESIIQTSKREPFGIAHHPHCNIIASFGSDGHVRMWGT